MFEENWGREIGWLSWRHRFRQASFSKCFPFTLKRKAWIFKFLRFEGSFRKVPFSWRIRVDGRRNRRKKAAFSNSPAQCGRCLNVTEPPSTFETWEGNPINIYEVREERFHGERRQKDEGWKMSVYQNKTKIAELIYHTNVNTAIWLAEPMNVHYEPLVSCLQNGNVFLFSKF